MNVQHLLQWLTLATEAVLLATLSLRIFLSLAGVLAFDSLFFYTAAFNGLPDYRNILLSGWLGKTIFAIIFSLILYVFLRRLPTGTGDETDSKPIRDIFNTLTYRQKYELQRRQGRKALDDKEALFRAVSEQSGKGIGIASTDGIYIMVNPAFCRMTGSDSAPRWPRLGPGPNR